MLPFPWVPAGEIPPSPSPLTPGFRGIFTLLKFGIGHPAAGPKLGFFTFIVSPAAFFKALLQRQLKASPAHVKSLGDIHQIIN